MNRRLKAVLAVIGILSACSTEGTKKTSSLLPEPPKKALTHAEANERSRLIDNTEYTLSLSLEPAEFTGKVTIQFDLKNPEGPSDSPFVDFAEGTLESLTINEQSASVKTRYDGRRIRLKPSELKAKGNRVEIAYRHPYSRDGNGLHRFEDPVDREVYLYSNFEPYSAHLMFPCFDQPDLKATYQLTVKAPSNWTVISSRLEDRIVPEGDQKIWSFPRTSRFSTYVFSVHAGPYAVWYSAARGIPLRLFSRQSLAQYVDSSEWFDVTRKGFQFFSSFFGTPYPFEKYDQLVVPEFNAGAMENVGAVTFSERAIFRSPATQDRRRRRADTILHEMAHMWFGNLVTMQWWNGLWLNESFATFMAAWATEQATPFKGSWPAFFSDMKKWAYYEDQLVTTHPIEVPVPDTDFAESAFDGITYGKGASVLKQLSFYIGESQFKAGLQRYFERFAFKNTTLAEFMNTFAETSKQDLKQWQELWLQTPGVNTVKADWKCTGPKGAERISEFKLIQSGDPLRAHATRLAFFRYSEGREKKLIADPVFKITYTDQTTDVRTAIGRPCPELVFPNFQDADYVVVELDPISLRTTSEHLSSIDDPFTRQMLWHTLWGMVTTGKLSASDYAEIAFSHIGKEQDTLILGQVLNTLARPVASRLSVAKILTQEDRTIYQARLEKFSKEQLLKAKPKSDQQILWFSHLLNATFSTAQIQFLEELLQGQTSLNGFEMDQERRWEILHALARNNVKGSKDLIAKELKKDPTSLGKLSSIAADAVIPEETNKKHWLDRITLKTADADLSLAQLRTAMVNFHVTGQEELTRSTVPTYFEVLAQSTKERTTGNEYLKTFAEMMFPFLCDQEMVNQVTRFLDTQKGLLPSVERSLREMRQETERCIKARDVQRSSKMTGQ